jgi:hypothetical protein
LLRLQNLRKPRIESLFNTNTVTSTPPHLHNTTPNTDLHLSEAASRALQFYDDDTLSAAYIYSRGVLAFRRTNFFQLNIGGGIIT